MKQPNKVTLNKLKKQSTNTATWEEVVGFKVSKPTSIRLSPNLIRHLETLAKLHGEKSYQTLLKKWVAERVAYEMSLVEQVRLKKAG